MINNRNISKSILMSVAILVIVVTISLLTSNQYNENNAFAAQVKSRNLTPFQSGFIDGFYTSHNGAGNNLGVHHTAEYFGGYGIGHYVGCNYHKLSNPSDTTNCGDKPATDYRSDWYLAGYVDQQEGVIIVLLNNVNNHLPRMEDYRTGYDDAANPCYGDNCYS